MITTRTPIFLIMYLLCFWVSLFYGSVSLYNLALRQLMKLVGWFAFNAGSAFAANARSVNSLVATHVSGCAASVVWVLLDYFQTKKWSIIGLCTGAVAGLATITPGSGFVTPSSSIAFGAIGSFVCYIAIHYKHKMGIDDCLDVFGGTKDIVTIHLYMYVFTFLLL